MNKISGILSFLAFFPYVWAIVVKGQTIPSPVTWFIWASVDTLTLVAMIKEKANVGQLVGIVVGAWIITILTAFFGKPTIELVDLISIIGALIGIALWKKYGDSLPAIVCSELAVLIGAIPTFIKTYTNPSQEDPIAWSIWFLSGIFAFLAIKKWDLKNALQPATFAVVDTIMFFLIIVI